MKLELKFHPAAEQPLKACLITAFIAFMGGVMFYVINNVLVVGVLLALMIGSLLPFYFPTYYTLDETALRMKRLGKERVYPWDKYRSFMVQKNGVTLWTVADLSSASQSKDRREKMAVLRNSVFLLMTPQMIGQAEVILRQKLAVTKTGE